MAFKLGAETTGPPLFPGKTKSIDQEIGCSRVQEVANSGDRSSPGNKIIPLDGTRETHRKAQNKDPFSDRESNILQLRLVVVIAACIALWCESKFESQLGARLSLTKTLYPLFNSRVLHQQGQNEFRLAGIHFHQILGWPASPSDQSHGQEREQRLPARPVWYR